MIAHLVATRPKADLPNPAHPADEVGSSNHKVLRFREMKNGLTVRPIFGSYFCGGMP